MEYRRMGQFDNENQRHAYNTAFEKYVSFIHKNKNPENKSFRELEQIHHYRFSSCNWDWDKQCFIPDEPEPLPTQKWRTVLDVEGKSKQEVFDEKTQRWIDVTVQSR